MSNVIKILKLSFGSSISIFLAWIMNLEYSMFAGIITLLSVKNTKKETLKAVLGKIYGFILCTLFSYLCFNILGYNLLSFSIYIFLIISICFAIKIQDVIGMCVVISSHYLLQGNVSFELILNEFGLFVIGAGISIIMNTYVPTNINKIYENQHKLEKEISLLLIDIAQLIKSPNLDNSYTKNLNTLNTLINDSTSSIYYNINNNLLTDTKFLLDHLQTIKSQRDIIANLYKYTSQLNYTPAQSYIIADFMYKISYSNIEFKNINILIDELDNLIHSMKNSPLPINRIEFENRAILFLCLNEIEKLLLSYLKQNGCLIEKEEVNY